MNMEKQERVVNILTDMGYKPITDKDGDIYFMYQMKHIYVIVNQPVDTYYSVFMPMIYSVDEGEEQLVLAACNKMTREIRCLKTFLDSDYKKVSSVFEFYSTEADLRMQIKEALDTIVAASRLFAKQMKEIIDLKNSE